MGILYQLTIKIRLNYDKITKLTNKLYPRWNDICLCAGTIAALKPTSSNSFEGDIWWFGECSLGMSFRFQFERIASQVQAGMLGDSITVQVIMTIDSSAVRIK